ILKRDLKLDFVVVNAENAAGGFGITENTARELFMAGADCLTLGNHSWDQREALTYIVREPRLIRPANYPRLMDAPGAGANLFETQSGKTVLVMNVLRSEEHTSELQSRENLVCRLLLEKKNRCIAYNMTPNA